MKGCFLVVLTITKTGFCETRRARLLGKRVLPRNVPGLGTFLRGRRGFVPGLGTFLGRPLGFVPGRGMFLGRGYGVVALGTRTKGEG